MSTDTYIDFHTPESWCLYRNDVREWSAYLKDREKDCHQEYDPLRIGHIANFYFYPGNTDTKAAAALYYAWEHFRDEYESGILITEELITQFMADYSLHYNLVRKAQKAESTAYERSADNPYPLDPDDISSPEEVEEELRKKIGWCMDFVRVD